MPDQSIIKIKTISVEQVIDASLGAYAVGDVVGADDCCTTLAITWVFDFTTIFGGFGKGDSVIIHQASLFNETENQAVQHDLILFNALPTGELRDNAANTNPLKGDKSKWQGVIEFPASVAKGSTVATFTEAMSTNGSGLPHICHCATTDTKIYGVLVTNTVFTQTAGDTIRITLKVERVIP